MCSLHLTHPSAHTWSSGQPTVQRPGSSRGLPAGARIQTHNLGILRVSSPTLYPLGHDCPIIKGKYQITLLIANEVDVFEMLLLLMDIMKIDFVVIRKH